MVLDGLGNSTVLIEGVCIEVNSIDAVLCVMRPTVTAGDGEQGTLAV